MRKLLFFLFFLIFNSNADYKLDEFFLENGLKVVMIEKKSVPIISCSIWFNCGSKCDDFFKSGCAHFLEHLAFLNHKREFSNYLEEIGAEKNAFTFINTICFYEIFPKDCLEKVLFFESQRMKSLEIEDKVFQNEKKAILEERNMRIDANIYGKHHEIFSSNIFNRQVGGIPVIGWKHEIESIQINDLQAFYEKWITPNNATIILVGDFEKKKAKLLIKKYFENIASKKLPNISYHNKEIFSPKLVECKSVKNGSLATIKYTYRVPFLSKNNLRKSIALSLALEILEKSPFFIKGILKQMTDIILDANFSSTDLIYDYDILTVSFYTNSIDNLDKTNDSWPYFRKKIMNGCIDETELQKIKKRKLIALAYQKEDIEQIANYFGWNLISGLSLKEILSLDNLVQSITVKECNDVLKEVFSTSPILIMKTLPQGYDHD